MKKSELESNKIKGNDLAKALFVVSKVKPMQLENKTWTIEIGKTHLDPWDFTACACVYINGEEVGWVDVDLVQDMLAKCT